MFVTRLLPAVLLLQHGHAKCWRAVLSAVQPFCVTCLFTREGLKARTAKAGSACSAKIHRASEPPASYLTCPGALLQRSDTARLLLESSSPSAGLSALARNPAVHQALRTARAEHRTQRPDQPHDAPARRSRGFSSAALSQRSILEPVSGQHSQLCSLDSAGQQHSA